MSTKLYAILVRHVAPKDRHESIEAFVIANDDVAVRDRVDTEFNHGAWADISEEGDKDLGIYDERWTQIGEDATYLDRMLRVRGDYNDEGDDSLWEDAYYGRTHYGWSEGKEISPEQIATLIALDVARDWRAAA